MYTKVNFKTKKELIERVKQWNFFCDSLKHLRGLQLEFSILSGQLECRPEGSTDRNDWQPFQAVAERFDIWNPQVRAWANLYVGVFEPAGQLAAPTHNGHASVEGPWAPKPHTWYANITLKDGIVISVD